MPGTPIKRAGVIISLIIITIILFLMIFSTAALAVMLGDVNNDGIINVQDVVLVQKQILELTPQLTDAQKAVADVNGDGEIDILDVNLISQMSLGLINAFPVMPAPALSLPADNANVSGSSINFQWLAFSGATRYQVEVIRVSDSAVFKSEIVGNFTSLALGNFPDDGTRFRWRLRAGNDVGWGSWSGYRNFVNGISPATPAAPALSLPAYNATIAGSSINFQWLASSGANRYELEVVRVSDNATFKKQLLGNETSSTQTDFLNDGAQYRWSVRAGNDAGWSSPSVSRTFINTTTIAAQTLITPLDNANIAGSSIFFSWSPVSGASKYEIEIFKKVGASYIPFKKEAYGNVTSVTLDVFNNDGTEYRWQVRAGNDLIWGNPSVLRTFINGDPMSVPVLITPVGNANIAGSSIFFSWAPVIGANKYELEIFKKVGTSYTPFKKEAYGNVTSVTLDGFPNDGTEYRWQVRAGNDLIWGNLSVPRTLTNGTPIAAPELVSPADNANTKSTSVLFEWKLTNGADKYELEIIDSEDKIYRTISLGNTTASIQHDLLNNAHYRWKVRGYNDDHEGAWSGTRNLIVGNLLSAPALISPAEKATVSTTTVSTTTVAVTTIEFKWATSSGANKYEFEIMRVRDGAVFGSNDSVTGTTYEQAGFTNDGAEYKWRVRAGKNIGTGANATIGWGAWSGYRHFINEDPDLLVLPAPNLLSPANDSLVANEPIYEEVGGVLNQVGSEIAFDWEILATADKYELEVISVSDSTVFRSRILTTSPPSKETGFPNDGTEFMWRVRAGDATDWGAWSFYSTFTNGFWWLNLF